MDCVHTNDLCLTCRCAAAVVFAQDGSVSAYDVEAAAESELAALEAEMLEEELPAVPSEVLPARTEETAVAAAQEAEAREEPEPEPEPEPERVAVLA